MVRKGVLVLLACLAYLNALNNPFVYDDHDTVVANPSLVDLSNIRFLFLYSPFRPIVNLSYAVDRWLWGYRPLGFHLTNVALHAIVVILLYGLVTRVFEDAGRRMQGRTVAFFGAALFAAHPLQTEAVAYVSGRSELLCAAWFMGGLILARDAICFGGRARAILAVMCGALAVGSKEVGIMLPVVIFAYDRLLRPGDDEARRRRVWRVFVPGLLGALAFAAYRLAALRQALGTGSPLLNLLTQSVVVWRYLRLLVWPSGQSIMHGVGRVGSISEPAALMAAAGLTAVAVIALALRRRAPVVAFGVFWFLITLAPSSSVVSLAEGMAEHRVYLASAGIFIAISGAIADALALRRTASRGVPIGYAALAGILIAALFALTVIRNQVWSDPVTLWAEATVHAEGMWEPHYALADALRERGNCAAAAAEYRTVVELSPSNRDAHVNLGICLAQTGQLDEAEGVLRHVLEIDPGFVRGYTNLGALALLQGDPARARDFYREAAARDRNNVLARMQLASLYEHTFHDYHAAARMCGEARAIAPSTPGVAECVERNEALAAAEEQGLVRRRPGEGGR